MKRIYDVVAVFANDDTKLFHVRADNHIQAEKYVLSCCAAIIAHWTGYATY
jgi:hypothetical protein